MHVVVKNFERNIADAVLVAEDSTELREKLAEFGDGEFFVIIDGKEMGPAYAAADNYEESLR